MEDFKKKFAESLASTILSSHTPVEEAAKIWADLKGFVNSHIPKKLYRFRPCNADSFISLEQATISTCVASKFKDKYDSLPFVNKAQIRKFFSDVYESGIIDVLFGTNGEDGTILSVVGSQYGSDVEGVLKKMICELPESERKTIKDKEFWQNIMTGIEPLIQEHINYVPKDRFTKIACFTEDIQSKHMWDYYAGGYSGFAIEYDMNGFMNNGCEVCPNVDSCNHEFKNITSLFPVIYTDQRYDATENIFSIIFNQLLKNLGFPDMILPLDQLFWYKSYLYKSCDSYAPEKEWRMICRCPAMQTKDYVCIPDRDSAKAIYYGPDIEERYKDHLRKVAKMRGLDEYDVGVDQDNPRFELKLTKLL